MDNNTNNLNGLSKERTLLMEQGYTPFTDLNGVKDMRIVVDTGSTETRSIVLQNASEQNIASEILAVDSKFAVLSNNIDHILSTSDNIYDNLEYTITDITDEGVKPEKVFEKLHLVKGRLLQQVDAPAEMLDLNLSKSVQQVTYVNILSNIAIRNLMQVFKTGTNHSDINLDVTSALTSQDTNSKHRLNSFEDKLSGVYEVEFPRFKVKFTLHIDSDDVYVENEGSAVARYWATTLQKDLKAFKRVIVIDGGGKSFDYCYIEDGVLVNRGSYSSRFGGERFKRSVAESYINEFDAEEPSLLMIEESLPTGLLQDGNDFIDITNVIKKVKIEYAKKVIKDLDVVCSKSEIQPNQVNLIITAGRAFKPSKNDKTSVPKLSSYVKKAFQVKNSSIEVSNVPGDFPLVLGLLFFRLTNPKKIDR